MVLLYVGEVGGQLGLCLGASILTLMEFGEALILITCRCCSKRVQGKQKKAFAWRSKVEILKTKQDIDKQKY